MGAFAAEVAMSPTLGPPPGGEKPENAAPGASGGRGAAIQPVAIDGVAYIDARYILIAP